MRLLLSGVFAMALAAPTAAQVHRDDDLAQRVATVVRGYVQIGIFDDVTIDVSDRSVTLQGRVTMPFKREEIGARVAKIDGIRTVTNNIRVLPLSNYDSDLRQRIAQAIYGHSTFWRYASMSQPPIHIIVENGRVTLTGVVGGEFERTLAGALAHVPGAFAVTNALDIDR